MPPPHHHHPLYSPRPPPTTPCQLPWTPWRPHHLPTSTTLTTPCRPLPTSYPPPLFQTALQAKFDEAHKRSRGGEEELSQLNDDLRRRLADITDYYSMAEHKHSAAVKQIQAHRGLEHQLNDKVAKYEEEVKRLISAREHDSLLMDELRAGHQVIWPFCRKFPVDASTTASTTTTSPAHGLRHFATSPSRAASAHPLHSAWSWRRRKICLI